MIMVKKMRCQGGKESRQRGRKCVIPALQAGELLGPMRITVIGCIVVPIAITPTNENQKKMIARQQGKRKVEIEEGPSRFQDDSVGEAVGVIVCIIIANPILRLPKQ